jgi:two-component system chemotaxis response regulator CheY
MVDNTFNFAGGTMASNSMVPVVLVADDSSVARRQVANALCRLTLELREASDGFQALEVIETTSVALLITDINMPRMGGVELLITVFERGFKVPSIVLTSEARVERLREARGAGALGWITKPFDPDHLATSVSRALSRSSLPQGSAP